MATAIGERKALRRNRIVSILVGNFRLLTIAIVLKPTVCAAAMIIFVYLT